MAPNPNSKGEATTDNAIVKVIGISNNDRGGPKGVIPLDDSLVQVDDKVYDVRGLSQFHPGGQLFVRAFGGRDATEAFLSYHRRLFPHDKMKDFFVKSTETTKSKPSSVVDADYLELCKRVEKELPRHESFAPFRYYLKTFLILGSCIGLEVYIHTNKMYVWHLCMLQGWLMALVGLNIQHDANHGAISKRPWVNKILGLTQNWIGGSHLDWIHQHVVQHHVNCNDVNHDPDLAGNPILRLNPLKPLMKLHLFQHLYVFVLIAGFGFNVVTESFLHVLRGKMFTSYSKSINSYRWFETLSSLFYFYRWIYLPYKHSPSLNTFFNIAPMFMTGGFYLALFFLISHNYKGVTIFNKDDKNAKESFLYRQVVSSSNVGGRFLCFINGGLNYQIEHHLFPRISHVYYPRIAPIVRKFCEEKKIPYQHFPTLWENLTSCSRHLYEMAREEGKKLN